MAQGGICEDRVVIVTGAGRGIGRSHALELARQGAKVVVNDLGVTVNGRATGLSPAAEVVAQIKADGGEAVASTADVSDWDAARQLIDVAVRTYGRLDVLVNNAGILRDRMFVSMEPDEWDAIMRVHLRGTFAPSRHAASYWRERSKAGETLNARIINTSSGSGLYGNAAQSNYGAAKAGIASFTINIARELARYGITVNAIAPVARTRMTEDLGRGRWVDKPSEGEFDRLGPDNISPVVAWLASAGTSDITGRVINVDGPEISIAIPWHQSEAINNERRWRADELGPLLTGLIARVDSEAKA